VSREMKWGNSPQKLGINFVVLLSLKYIYKERIVCFSVYLMTLFNSAAYAVCNDRMGTHGKKFWWSNFKYYFRYMFEGTDGKQKNFIPISRSRSRELNKDLLHAKQMSELPHSNFACVYRCVSDVSRVTSTKFDLGRTQFCLLQIK
jgi:hypothetical protein